MMFDEKEYGPLLTCSLKALCDIIKEITGKEGGGKEEDYSS